MNKKNPQTNNSKPNPIIKNNTEEPIEVLASAIIEVAAGAKKLLNSRLNKRAIVTLIHDACPQLVTRKQIEAVLETASNLDIKFLKK